MKGWFQFSLRTFFLVLTLFAVLFGGGITYERDRCHRGQAAAKALEEKKMGMLANLSFFYFSLRLPSQIIINKEPTHEARPEWLRDILGDNSFEAVWYVSLQEENATDANLAHVGQLTGIKELHLAGGTFTDSGLAQLKGLSQLESLYIVRGVISDRGIAELAKLPRLKKLDLNSTSVSGSGLAGFSRLEKLQVNGSPLTAEGLAAIRRIPALKDFAGDVQQ